MTERSMKSLLKSTSCSVDKLEEKTHDTQINEAKSPSTVPEDSVEKEVSKQSKLASAGTTDQEKKDDKTRESKEESVQVQGKSIGETSGTEKMKEEKDKEGRLKDEDKSERLEKKKSSSDDGDKEENSETKEKNMAGNRAESEERDELVTTSTTKLRGKSKATGQIMGGWI